MSSTFTTSLTKWEEVLEEDYKKFLLEATRNSVESANKKWGVDEEVVLRTNFMSMTDIELAAFLGRIREALLTKWGKWVSEEYRNHRKLHRTFLGGTHTLLDRL